MARTPKEAFSSCLKASHVPTQVKGAAVISPSVVGGMWQISC